MFYSLSIDHICLLEEYFHLWYAWKNVFFLIQDVKIKTTSICSNSPEIQCTAGSPHFTLQKKKSQQCLSESADDVYAQFIPSAECRVVKVMRQKVSCRFN